MKIILLFTGGRSGSDLLQSLLDGHPEVAQFPAILNFTKDFLKIEIENWRQKIVMYQILSLHDRGNLGDPRYARLGCPGRRCPPSQKSSSPGSSQDSLRQYFGALGTTVRALENILFVASAPQYDLLGLLEGPICGFCLPSVISCWNKVVLRGPGVMIRFVLYT